MLEQERITQSATLPILEQLIDAGPGVPEVIRNRFRGELFASPHAAFVGVMLAFALDLSALALTGQRAFALVLAVEVSLAVVRWLFIRRSMRAAALAARMPTDFAIALTMSWHTLQGIAALLSMWTGNGSLQVLASIVVMGLQGQVCAKHFAAPRLVHLCLALSVGPFLVGALLSGDPSLLLLFFFLPAYTFGNLGLASRYRVRAISSLQGQYDGQHRSRHDPLTGLCNRLGLFEQLGSCSGRSKEKYAVFYLDLDGFKAVNDLARPSPR